MKKVLLSAAAVGLSAVTLLGITGCGGKGNIPSNEADPERTFTYWIHTEDGTQVGGVYDAYDHNPGVLYATKDPFTYKTAVRSGDGYTQGEEVTNNVALRFQSATTGQEQNSWITALGSGQVDILELDYASETVQTMYENGKLLDLTYWVENYMPNYTAFMEENGLTNYVTTEIDGERRYLQLYTYLENLYRYYYGYQYRADWLIEYGRTFDPETGAIGTQTFAEAHPDWGWSTNAEGEKVWTDGVVFPSWYGLVYTSDGSATGMGTFRYDADVEEYMQGEYRQYASARETEIKGALFGLERDFDDYQGQWPATISDWEWMLDIMQIAIAEQNYSQGYCMSLYQYGFVNTGNLVSSFGGSGVEWQSNRDNTAVVFGADQPAFRTYVETMRDWYSNGWIDHNFQSHTDLFWRTDENNVRQGYVGIYYGMNDQLLDGMDMGTPTTDGICSKGMPYPVNDKYGSEEQQLVMPYTFYCLQPEVNSIMVTTDAERNGKDLAALFTFLDSMYTEEMSVVKGYGLTKEMLDTLPEGVHEIYEDVGYPDGTSVYIPDPEGGKGTYYRAEGPALTTEQEYYTSPKRLFGYEAMMLSYSQMKTSQWEEYLWNFFEPTEYLTKSFYGQLTPDQYDIYYQKLGELRNALSVDIPRYIKGEKPLSDWDGWYSELKRTCQVDQITNMLNNVYRELHGLS